MREASEYSQLIVATHSDRLIGFLKPDEVLVMDADEEGLTKMTWADDDELDLAHWLEDYSLDELWRMGIMGGRP
jgi:predicted ATPase